MGRIGAGWSSTVGKLNDVSGIAGGSHERRHTNSFDSSRKCGQCVKILICHLFKIIFSNRCASGLWSTHTANLAPSRLHLQIFRAWKNKENSRSCEASSRAASSRPFGRFAVFPSPPNWDFTASPLEARAFDSQAITLGSPFTSHCSVTAPIPSPGASVMTSYGLLGSQHPCLPIQ